MKRRKRKPSEFARIYGSKARVQFVKALPCAACGIVGYSDNAHVLGNDGLSRKADYTTIAPLCHARWKRNDTRRLYVGSPVSHYWGCHGLYDKHRGAFNHEYPDFNPERAAAETQAAWAANQGADRT